MQMVDDHNITPLSLVVGGGEVAVKFYIYIY